MLDEKAAEWSVANTLSKVLPRKSTGTEPRLSYQVQTDRILIVCMAIEDEKISLVQRRWRQKIANRKHWLEYRSATRLQAAMRGKLTRRDFLPEHKAPPHAPRSPSTRLHHLRPSAAYR